MARIRASLTTDTQRSAQEAPIQPNDRGEPEGKHVSQRIIVLFTSFSIFVAGQALGQTPATDMSAVDGGSPSDTGTPPSTTGTTATTATTAATAPMPNAEVKPPDNHPNAGFGNEVFFLRSSDDNFILIPSGRFQMDWYGYQGGVAAPFNTFLPKRARIETFGTFMHHWDFQLGAEYTGTAPPVATDVYVNGFINNAAQLQIGQFDAPFTMENRTSDKWTDMQERSRVVAAFAIPENKEFGAMFWGQPDAKWAYWSSGIFDGEGQNLFKHTSNHVDSMSRAWIAPLGLAGVDLLKNVWVGGSFWTGFRGISHGGFTTQNDRKSMTDEAGFTFFNPVTGNIHAGTYGEQTKYAIELNAPIGPIVIKGEYVGVDEGLRELDLTNAAKPLYVRTSNIQGNGFYGRISYTAFGDPLINGLAGMQNPPHLFGELKEGKTATALQFVANVDHIAFDYNADNDPNHKDKLAGSYVFNAYGFGTNFWYTKHVRLTGNFIYEVFDGPGPRMNASGNTAYEFALRVALAL
jgi:phosphate-selective porin